MHALSLFLTKAALILLTPVLLILGGWLAWRLVLWGTKRSIRQFDNWLQKQ